MRFFTKEWYAIMQKAMRVSDPQKRAQLLKEWDAAPAAYQKAIAREGLPKELHEKFYFHDGKIRSVQEGPNCVIEIRSPFSTYNKVTFCGAIIKGDPILTGAVWLYEELYRHALGYEAHILCWTNAGLTDTKIICADILLEEESEKRSTING